MSCSLLKPSVMLCTLGCVGALLLANVASGQASLVLALPAPRVSHTQQPALSCTKQRCLGLHVAPKWRAAARAASTRVLMPSAVANLAALRPTYASTQRRAPLNPALGVGAHIALRAGRELDLQLTPTPAQCAPLVTLRY